MPGDGGGLPHLVGTNLDVTNANIANLNLDPNGVGNAVTTNGAQTITGVKTFATSLVMAGPDPWYDVRAYGAKGDVRRATNGVMNGTTAVLTSASGRFAAGDVGKYIEVAGAGAAGATLFSTIASYQSATQVTLAAVSATVVAAATFNWGTDDTVAINAALLAIQAAGPNLQPLVGLGTLFFPPGIYFITPGGANWLQLYSNMNMKGCGWSSTLLVTGNQGNYEKIFAPSSSLALLSNVVIEDLTIDQNALLNTTQQPDTAATTTYAAAIQVFNGKNIRINRCNFVNSPAIQAVVIAAGNTTTVTNVAVTNCYFNFVMRPGATDYDNSACYLEGVNIICSGNTFETTIQSGRGGRAAMEMHAGPGSCYGNVTNGFRTGVNVVGPAFGGEPLGDIAVFANSFEKASRAVMIWPTALNLIGVNITGNAIQIQNLDPLDDTNYGIASVPQAANTGTLQDFVISNNTIRFQDEGAGRVVADQTGIGLVAGSLGGQTTAIHRNGVIAGNVIELAGVKGIQISQGSGASTFNNIQVTGNAIINPGSNVNAISAIRTGIILYGTATDVTIEGNQVSDTFATTRCGQSIQVLTGGTYSRVKVRGNHISSATTPLTYDIGRTGVIASYVGDDGTGNALWDAFGASGTHSFRTNNGAVVVGTLDNNGTLRVAGALQGNSSGNVLLDAVGATGVLTFRTNGGSTNLFKMDAGGHLISLASGTPATSALGANVTSATFTGNDVRGTIAVVMSGALAANTRAFTATFAVTYGATAPKVTLVDQTSAVGLTIVNSYVSAQSTGVSFDVAFDQALGAGTYTIDYIVIG